MKNIEKLRHWRDTIAHLEKFAAAHQARVAPGCSFHEPLTERIARLVHQYEDQALKATTQLKQAHDDTLVFCRACSMLVQSALNADTHKVKNSRLMALIEIIETTIKNLREDQFELGYRCHEFPDLFRADWPDRAQMHRIHELQAKIRDLEQALERAGAPIQTIADLPATPARDPEEF